MFVARRLLAAIVLQSHARALLARRQLAALKRIKQEQGTALFACSVVFRCLRQSLLGFDFVAIFVVLLVLQSTLVVLPLLLWCSALSVRSPRAAHSAHSGNKNECKTVSLWFCWLTVTCLDRLLLFSSLQLMFRVACSGSSLVVGCSERRRCAAVVLQSRVRSLFARWLLNKLRREHQQRIGIRGCLFDRNSCGFLIAFA